MTLPQALHAAVTAALAEHADGSPEIVDVRPVGGGCIHRGTRISTRGGEDFFLKWSHDAPRGMFEAEVDGLRALGDSGVVRVPDAVAWDDARGETAGWLLMEFVEPAPSSRAGGRRLGESLARIHAGAPADAPFGWHRDNWIGSLPQRNLPVPEWGAFWRERRLVPQLELARSSGHLREEVFDRAVEAGSRSLAHVRRAELLHGDLWSGNTYASRGGAPVLVDPAVYRGDGEVDLAMSELFGGFEPDFYRAYDALRPISPAYRTFARDLYQLYYLLVHVNLFGSGYARPAREAATRVVAALDG